MSEKHEELNALGFELLAQGAKVLVGLSIGTAPSVTGNRVAEDANAGGCALRNIFSSDVSRVGWS
jgi:hypothetical protein